MKLADLLALRGWSLRSKLTLASALASSAALLTAGVLLLYFITGDALQDEEEDLDLTARVLARNTGKGLAHGDREEVAHVLDGLAVDEMVVAAGLYDAGGLLFGSYVREGAPALSERMNPATLRDAPDTMRLLEPVMYDGARIGWLYLEADHTQLEERGARAGLAIGIACALGALLAALLARELGAPVVKPILELAALTHRVRESNFSERAEVHAEDEVGGLAQAVNQMLSRIERDRMQRSLQIAQRQSIEEAEISAREEIERARIASDRGLNEARILQERDLKRLEIERAQALELESGYGQVGLGAVEGEVEEEVRVIQQRAQQMVLAIGGDQDLLQPVR